VDVDVEPLRVDPQDPSPVVPADEDAALVVVEGEPGFGIGRVVGVVAIHAVSSSSAPVSRAARWR
jgi:hypothetical protein